MKAFEEWQDSLCYAKPGQESIPCLDDCSQCKFARAQGWRSALGWLYDQLGYSEEHEELKDLIEKELEE